LSATTEEDEEELIATELEEDVATDELEELTTEELLELDAGAELDELLEANGFWRFLNTIPAHPFPAFTVTCPFGGVTRNWLQPA
jgi:hypothetical protein